MSCRAAAWRWRGSPTVTTVTGGPAVVPHPAERSLGALEQAGRQVDGEPHQVIEGAGPSCEVGQCDDAAEPPLPVAGSCHGKRASRRSRASAARMRTPVSIRRAGPAVAAEPRRELADRDALGRNRAVAANPKFRPMMAKTPRRRPVAHLRAPISTSAVINGDFRRADAEVIVDGIRAR